MFTEAKAHPLFRVSSYHAVHTIVKFRHTTQNVVKTLQSKENTYDELDDDHDEYEIDITEENWNRNIHTHMAVYALVISASNIFRFPDECYRYGGGDDMTDERQTGLVSRYTILINHFFSSSCLLHGLCFRLTGRNPTNHLLGNGRRTILSDGSGRIRGSPHFCKRNSSSHCLYVPRLCLLQFRRPRLHWEVCFRSLLHAARQL